MIIKTFQYYLIKLFLKRVLISSMIFLSLIFILNIFDEISFFKNVDTNIFYPYLIALLNTPSALFEIFPFIFLIATQFFFIYLIQKGELEVLKVNGLVLYNYTKKPYVVGKELFYSLFGGKNSIRIADGHCLILPNDPQLYKQKYPFGIIPIDNIIGRVVASDEGSLGSDATPIGLKSHLRGDKFDAFDASGRAGHYIND